MLQLTDNPRDDCGHIVRRAMGYRRFHHALRDIIDAALTAHQDGQRMAALPAALVAGRLALGKSLSPGAGTVYELLGHSPLLSALAGRGYQYGDGGIYPAMCRGV